VNEDGLIDYQEFGQINDRYPLVLFPAFRLQDVMQRNSLGKYDDPTSVPSSSPFGAFLTSIQSLLFLI